jgi:hypothetical protein
MSTDERLPTYTIELTEDLQTGERRIICGWSCERDEVEIYAEAMHRLEAIAEWVKAKREDAGDEH